MKKKNHLRLWVIGILAILLLVVAVPALRAEIIPAGQTKDINYDVTGILWVYGTANLQTGASVSQYIYVQNGGTLNMYSGTIGLNCFINIGTKDAGMTVYGTEFVVSNGTIDPNGSWTPAGGMGTLTGKYEDESQINLWIFSDIPIKLKAPASNDTITIDIKPGSNTNSINLSSRGVVPVAVLTTDQFNAGTLPDYSILFAGASPVRTTLCDVDEDGDMDMLFHFKTQDLVELNEDSTEAKLTAMLKGGITSSAVTAEDIIQGTDKVKIKPSGKKYRSSGKNAS